MMYFLSSTPVMIGHVATGLECHLPLVEGLG